MAHIVCAPCIRCKYTDCVAVCPVDCFHEGINVLVINPDTCIDCGLCPSECPVDAIYTERDLLPEYEDFIEINAKYSLVWPVISAQKDPLPGAGEAAKEENKKDYINLNDITGETNG